jgi:DNA-binding SARP family transcriptional activator
MSTDFIHTLLQRESDATRPVLHLFGGPYVSVGRHRIEIPEGSKRLLVFVALRSGRVERPYAAGTLWPGGDDTRAAGNLRSALWRLNKVEADLLETDKHTLALHPRVRVDLHLVADWAGRVAADGAPLADLRTLPRAFDALDLLPGWYDDWALIERERIRQRFLHALEAQSRNLALAGYHAEAVDAALLAVGADPLRESAQRALVQAHLSEGNWTEAHHAYLAYARMLRRELGVEPCREFTELINDHLRMCRPARHPARRAAPVN